MDRARFERLVAEAVEKLPDEFHEKLANIDVVVERQPSSRDLSKLSVETTSKSGRKYGEPFSTK